MLWDIDHTLIDSGGAGVHVYQLVFRDLFGRDLPDLVPFAERTERARTTEPAAVMTWCRVSLVLGRTRCPRGIP